MKPTTPFYGLAPALLLSLCFACGGSDNGDPPGDDASLDGMTQGDGSEGGSCTRASDCASGLVCAADTKMCEASTSCVSHTECGLVGYCSDDGCAPNDKGGPCDDDINCVSGERCTEGLCGCGGQRYTAENIPPNLLVLLDRSDSMLEDAGGKDKWTIARETIRSLLLDYSGRVRFGLKAYPGENQACTTGQACTCDGPSEQGGTPPACEGHPVHVDVSPDSASDINTFLEGAGTCTLGTPIGNAVHPLRSYPELQDTSRDNYLLLLTDGKENCSADYRPPAEEVKALFDATPSVKTFVVGFDATGEAIDAAELTEFAEAGGTARAGELKYYEADDEASLQAAFATIAGSIISCTYELSETPPDRNKLFVYFDDDEVARDTTRAGGWDYDDEQGDVIQFYGAECDALQAGTVSELIVQYGCPLSLR